MTEKTKQNAHPSGRGERETQKMETRNQNNATATDYDHVKAYTYTTKAHLVVLVDEPLALLLTRNAQPSARRVDTRPF